MRGSALSVFALLTACTGTSGNGYAVNLAVVVSPTVTAEELKRIDKISVEVSGAETFAKTFPVAGQLSSRKVTLIYRPALKQRGTDRFIVVGSDDNGPIAVGAAEVEVVPGQSKTVTVTIGKLDPNLELDGGDSDGGSSDDGGGGAPKALGESCQAGVDVCETGHCVDGVCCNEACANECMACNLTGKVGVCSTVPDGDAPVHGNCPALAANDLTKKCSTDGKCDGTGLCRLWAANTPCGDAICDPATNVFTPQPLCDGAGRCIQPTAYNCKPYKCNGTTACFDSCNPANSDAECCTDIALCSGVVNSCMNNSCGKKPLGRSCSDGNECEAPGLCVDGVCCNGTCTGQCEACNADPMKLGECLPIAAGQTPHLTNGRMKCTGDGTTCGGTCDGTTRTQCSYPTTQCYTKTCSTATGKPIVTHTTNCSNGACTPSTTDCTTTGVGLNHTVASCNGTTQDCQYACVAGWANCGNPGAVQTVGCPDPLNTQTNCGSCGYSCTTNLVGSTCNTTTRVCECTNGQLPCPTPAGANPAKCYTPSGTNCCRPNGQNGCNCGGVTCTHYSRVCCGGMLCVPCGCDQWSYTCSPGDCAASFVDDRFNTSGPNAACFAFSCAAGGGSSTSRCSINPS